MVAVFTGSGLGLYNTSYTQLGFATGGNAGIGQSRESQYVNLATGNLVLQDLDESLVARGLSAAFLRTYNSRGVVAGTGQDGWVTGFERNLTLTGTLNAVGSTMTLTTGDGQSVVFTYSGTANNYTTTGGDGAHDSLVWDGTNLVWTYTEGSTRREERYADHANATLKGRLLWIRNLRTDGTNPARYDVLYDANNRVSQVRAVDGGGTNADSLIFAYNTAGQLASVSTREGGTTRVQVTYGYENADGSGRLSWVQTDLTPEITTDNTWDATTAANNDGKRFRTSYTYVSTTVSDLRIASVSTSDGVNVAYTYEADGAGGFRVKTVTRGGAGDGSTQTTTFVYNANSTDVIDGAGRTWTYEYDANRQLIGVLEPAVDGLRQKTSYTYDASGNLIRVSQAATAGGTAVLDTVFRYDANGNRTLQRDLLGNTIAWTYSTANQVTAETRYTVADADGLDPNHTGTTNLPSGALTTRYIYDSRNRVRFVVNAAGEVRELTYATTGNGIGQVASERTYLGATYSGTYTEAALNTWATDAVALRKSNSALTVYGYDAKGRVSQTETYATVSADVNGTGVLDAATDLVRYTYDAQGLLRQKIAVRGSGRTLAGAAPTTSEIVDYVYDGMGRLLSQLSRAAATTAMPDARIDPTGYATWLAANDATTLLTAYAYVDSANQIRVDFDGGATRTATHNRAGAVVSASDAGLVGGSLVTRTTQNFYDASGRLRASQDAAGGRTYYFYDAAGRLSSVVDPTGAVARTVYDGVGRGVQTVAYAIRVNTTGWISGSTVVKDTLIFAATAPALTGSQAWVQTDAANDRNGYRTYDNGGRIATETDAAGLLTTYAYDGANRLLSTTLSKPGDATVTPRVQRMFYDNADRVVGTLDAEGSLVEAIYDAGGRLIRSVRYATPTSVALRATGTLAALRPVAPNPADQTTRYFYDARGQQIGILNAEGYLTEFVYDEAANQRAVKAYAKQLTGLSGSETFVALRTSATTGAPTEAFRLTQRSFNALGQVATELNHEGTVTNYIYDEAGRLVKTQSAAGTSEVREGNRRYDVFGNLIGELAGEGSTRLLGGMTETQIDAIYAQYGVRHSYDLVGRRTESIDAAGNKTWYFYDAAGRQTFVVRGVHDASNVQNAWGEVVETRYNAFGQASDAIVYTGRITLAVAGSRASAQSAIQALTFNATTDSRIQLRYDRRGQLSERIDAENYRTLYTYTAFGEVRTQQDLELDNSVRRTVTNTYDGRGLLTGQNEAGGTLSRSIGVIYDAFGRATTRTDARNNTMTIAYDRLGRVLSQTANNVSGRNESVSTTYDAFDRVVTQTDALGRITNYVHSDSARSITVTTPEGVSATTVSNRFGQALTLTQTLPDGTVATTTTTYNKDGQVDTVVDALNRTVVDNTYDARGLLTSTVDASGRRVDYSYDAAGRTLTRREDPTGLNLTTTWTYDGQGRQLTVTDASNVRTSLIYDRKGNLIEAVLDPNGLALRTTYTWDRDGRQLTMTQGAGTAAATTVAYAYDAFGRRVTETVSPGALNLITTYVYDASDNVVRKTDASNRTTRYSYDAANRMRFSVDDAGGVSEVVYDAAGRATMTRSYAKVATITGLPLAPTEAEMSALVAAQTLANDAQDEVNYRIYDRDGRLVMTVDGTGGVIEIDYDSAGRKVLERRYAQPAALSASLRTQLAAGTATIDTVRALAGANAAKDVQIRFVYDAAGQVVFVLDAIGAVTRNWYDAAGRVVATRRYATTVNFASVGDATSVAALQALVVEAATDLGEYRVYDAAGRVIHLVDLAGTLQQIGYDGAGRMAVTRTYAAPFAITTTLRDALRAGTATAADFSAFATANEAAARAQALVYDSAGRQRYTILRSAAGIAEVAETQYDAAGRVTAQVRYGVNIAFGTSYTETGVGNALNAALSSDQLIRATQIRSQRYVYDTAGRQRFMLDATGALAEWRYDGAGRVTDAIAYGQRPPATTTTETGLSAWANAQPAVDVRRTRSAYDAAGRLQVKTDANNRTESYTYDAADRMLTRTDRNNAVWTYQYDAAGRRTAELSPQVAVTSVDAAGNVSTANRAIATRYTYDAFGNVLTRVDNADAPVTADRRTTRYVYDNRGYQVSTIFPDAGAYNVTTNALEATGVQATIEITYNALGQAVVQKDVRNFYSYKAYDAAGRVAYEVDQEGYATRYTYNAFGEVESLRRYATVTNTGAIAGWSQGQSLSMAQLQTAGVLTAGANDRVIDTVYTLLGRKATVTQSSITYYRADGSAATGSPVKTFDYNAFGDLTLESDLIEGVPGTGGAVWATATRYYDALGRNTMTVDAMGYVTKTEYNATGEATETIEYARALTGTPNPASRPGLPAPGDAAIGYDRITRWGYDALGRKISETSVRQYRRVDGSTGSRDVVATYGYDHEGRVTSISDDTGTTSTVYDAIGRAVSVQEAARSVLVQSVDGLLGTSASRDLTTGLIYEQRSPFTTMGYDAFGNAVVVRRYANGKDGANAAVADDTRDQVQLLRYDWQGRAVWERNATGATVTRRYDAADNVTEVRYTLQGNNGRSAVVVSTNTYDKTGRQLSNRTDRELMLSGVYQSTVVDSGETVVYNAFGEITQKTQYGLTGTLIYGYDTAGRLTSSNESGATRSYGYNLAGHLVRSAQNAYLSAAEGVISAVTVSRVDKLGRTLEVTLPSHTAVTSTTSSITQTVDRWGNVVRIIDARGYQTDYEYNSLNQLVREIRPLVKVVSENGGVTWQRPVNERYYDALGRLVATRDANGNLRANEYDQTGRLTVAKDAFGNATRFAYDIFGNQRITQNALGYLSFKEYDRVGRVVAIGDYLPSASGSTRNKAVLQSYVLNENGDRIQVTNALTQTARYDYDSRNQLIRSQTAVGVVMDYAYDAGARKIRESNAYSTTSGSLTDRDGESVRINEATWDYDVFGRTIDHNNLSGRDSNYAYDATSGQLTSETAAGGFGITTGNGTKTVSYYANGRIRQVVEGSTTYRYEYDATGNRTMEEVITSDIYGLSVHTVTRTTYDSNNRVERVTQHDQLLNKRIFDLITEYDANGNRRHVSAVSGYGPNVDGIVVTNAAPVVIRAVEDRTVRKGLTSQFRLLFTDIFRDAEQDALSLTIAKSDGSALPAWLVATRDPDTGEIVFTANPGAGLADQDIVVRLTATETANPANTTSTTFVVRVRTNTAPTLVQPGDVAVRVKTNQPWNKDLVASEHFRDADVGDVLALSIENQASLPSWLTVDASNPDAIRLSGTPTTSGTFTVRLRATDQQGAYIVKQFVITTAPNAAPQVVAVPQPVDAILTRQFEWTRPLANVFTDAEGDRMQVTARLSDGSALPAWMSFQYLYDQATPEIVFSGNVPADEVNGRVYNVVMTATDVDGASTSTTLVVRVFANRAPAPTGGTQTLPPLRVNDNYSQTFAISSFFSDPENDGLNLTTIWPNGSTLPQWLRMNVDYAAGTVTFSGRPNTNAQAGTLTFDVRATDIAGLTGTKSFSITIGTDTAPARTAVALADRTLSIGRSFSYTIPDGLFADADSDSFTLNAQMVTQYTESYWEDTMPPTWVTYNWVEYAPLPAWMTFNAATRTFSGVVPAGQAAGQISIRVKATDSRGQVSAANEQFVGGAGNTADGDIVFNLQPWVNSAPVYNGGLTNPTLVHGGAVNVPLPGGAFTEPDGDALSYSAQVLIGSTWTNISAIGLSINSTTGQITGTASNLTQASYSARIVASDGSLTGTGTFTFNVTNTPPTAGTIPAQTAGRNQAFNFNVAGYFSDVNSNPLTFTASGLPAGLSISTAGLISGTTTVALGNYTVTVTANDGRGGTVNASFTLTVANSAPVAPTINNQTATAGVAWSFTAPAFTDPNGDALTYTASGLPGWMTFNATTRVFSGMPGVVGSWSITLTATDTAGATASRTFTVTTPSTPPVYTPGSLANQTAQPSQAFTYVIPANTFTDPNGDTLTYSADGNGAALPSWLSFNAATRTFSGTPTAAGTWTIRVLASDGTNQVGATFTITTPNAGPAYNGTLPSRGATVNTPVSWALAGGTFTDANGDALTYTLEVERPGYWEQYYIAPGEPDFRWVDPAWISASSVGLSIAANGTISGTLQALYAPAQYYTSGNYQYYYDYNMRITARDPSNASVTGGFAVTANVAPTAPSISRIILAHNTPVSTTLPVFTDINGHALTYTATNLPPGLSFNPSTRVISGTGTTKGDWTVTYTATDALGAATSTTFTLTIGTDTAPVRTAVALSDRTVNIGRSFSYTIPDGLFVDNDGDSFALGAQMVTQQSESYWEDTIPPTWVTYNWVQYAPLPAWMTFNAATRTFSGTVPAGQAAGQIAIRVQATDSRGRVSAANEQFVGGAGATGDGDIIFNVQPWVNSAPVYNGGLTSPTLVHGGAVNVPLPGGAFTEPDGDALSYSAQVLIGSTWTNITAIGLSINSATGQITGTASNLTQASYSARIVASDGSLTGTGTFTFNVTNTPPTAGTIPAQTAGRNQAFNFNVAGYFSDVNSNPLTFTASGLPAGLSISTAGLISGSSTAALGGYAVTVTANDGRGGTVNASFTLTVANSAPVAPGVTNQTATAGSFFSYTPAAFSDPNGDALTYTATGLPGWMNFNTSTRTFSGTAGVVGSWTITYTATDTSGVSASTTFTVTTPSTPPVYAGGLTNQSASPGVGFNYTVPAGAFTDPNGDTLSYSADANGVALPSWLSFNAATRTFSGTPSGAGTWTIRVMASDGTSTASGTFTISTANVGPVYNGTLPARSGSSGTGVSWAMPGGAFTDANGDALTYTLEVERPGYWELYYIAPGEPDYRWIDPTWVSASAVGLSIASNGTVSGTLQALYSPGGFGGSYQYFYNYNMRITARDPSSASATGGFAVTVNVAPVAPGIGTVTARQNSAFNYTLPAFTDANGHALSYSVSNLPPGLSFDPGTRTIAGTPPTAGSWTVTYTANDGYGGVTNTTFTLTVQANNAPSAPAVGAQAGTINVALSLTLPAFTDADYDALSHSVSNLPPGLSFDPVTRTITGTPTTTGTWTVTYGASDGRGGTASTTFSFTINPPTANRAPVVSIPLDDQYAMSDYEFYYEIPANSFTDPDNNPLTYTATLVSGAALPAWLSFNGATRTFQGYPFGTNNQSWTIRVRATDPSGLSVYDDFLLYKEGNGGGPINLMSTPIDANAGTGAGAAPSGSVAKSAGATYRFDMGRGTAPAVENATAVSEPTTTNAAETQPVMKALATSVPVQVKDEWFVYDAENRLKLVGGQLIGAAGAVGTYIGLASGVQSYELMYDAVGQVVGRAVVSGTNQIVYRTTYDLRGRKQYEYHAEYLNPVSFAFGGLSKQYVYDAADRLTETRSYYQNGTKKNAPLDGEGFPEGLPMSVAGWLSGAETFTYDADGRMTLQVTLDRNNGINGIQWMEPGTYDDTQQRTNLNVLVENSRVMYSDAGGNSGYDALGRVWTYRYTAKEISWATHTYTSTYEGWEGYVEKVVTGTSTNTNYRATTNTLTYDAFGKLVRQIENTPLPGNYGTLHDRARAYTYNGDGRVQTRREGTIENSVFTQVADASGAKANYQFVHAAGQQQAELREGGQIRYNSGYTYNTPQIQGLNGSGNYAAGGGSVTVLQGETLQSLAQRVYGNASLWYVLADANGLSDPDGALIAGTQLSTPKVTVSNNDAGTFRPYDPSEAVGPTSPGLPYITPPPKKSCNPIAMILMVVVAVVVTVFTAGAAAMAMSAAAQGVAFGSVATSMGAIMTAGASVLTGGAIAAGAGMAVALGGSITAATMAAAAVGGFMGSVASQAVGMAMGVVDKFSLRSAVAGGLTAGFTAGIGSVMGPTKELIQAGQWGKVAASGALTAAGGYAANRIAGLDASFSWRSIAASAVTSVASALVSKGIGSVLDKLEIGNDIIRDTVTGFGGSVVALHTRRAFGLGGEIDYGAMALDAFGNALANAAVGKLSRVGNQSLSLGGPEAQLRMIDQAIETASGAELERLRMLRVEVLEGRHSLTVQSVENLTTPDGKAANAAYDSETGIIFVNRSLVDGARTAEGAAGLLGAYLEEVAEWVAHKSGIRYTSDNGVAMDTGAVNGMLAMQALASNYKDVSFTLNVGGSPSTFVTGSNEIFQASVRLFTPDRIMSNVQGDGVYYQQTSFATARQAFIQQIQRGLSGFGNGGAMAVGVAYGILENGWDTVKGLATLAGQVDGALKFAALRGVGLNRLAERYRSDFNAMSDMVDSVKGFVRSSWGKKWDAASEAVFGGFFRALEETQSTWNRLPNDGRFAPGAFFDFGRAAGHLVFEVVNIALTAVGAGAAIRAGTTLGRVLATRGASLATGGAGRLSGFFDDLASAASRFTTRTVNGYTYHLDDVGRVVRVEGQLRLNPAQGRNTTAQRAAGGADRLPDDQGGHYIGRRFDGPTEDFNHFAQNGNFNNSAYKRLENHWERLINGGSTVRVRIEPIFNGNSLRPDQLVVRQWINGRPVAPVTYRNQYGG
ncbi:putative Ig domain-containing protein [Lysobacter hankyongensis]|uniref:LysM domain-containing protein n=1 Tax=Lysobacter hankyongensis TaxID=1176535 RepID=A0ABP9BPM7_9GAMM